MFRMMKRAFYYMNIGIIKKCDVFENKVNVKNEKILEEEMLKLFDYMKDLNSMEFVMD